MKTKNHKIIYFTINIIFILLSLFFIFFNNLFDFNFTASNLILILALFLLVHLFRFARMYFILLEDLIEPRRFLQIYLKTTFVSTLIPFKIGELFKMYCYGTETNNLAKGVIAVIIEKFLDAIVICSFMLPYAIQTSTVNPLLTILLTFIILSLVIYFSFVGTYRYLNRFFICRGGGRKSLVILKTLDIAQKAYTNTKRTVRGRFIVLLFLSFLAWGTESLLLVLINSDNVSFEPGTMFTYINDAFFGINNISFNYYASLCAIIFPIILTFIYGKKYFTVINDKKGNHHD